MPRGNAWIKRRSDRGARGVDLGKIPGVKPEILKSLYARMGYNITKDKEATLVVPEEGQSLEAFGDFPTQWWDFWFNFKFRTNSQEDRQGRYVHYDDMDSLMPEAGMTLDAYADETVGAGFIKEIFEIKLSNKEVEKKVIETLDHNKFITGIRGIVRALCKWGDLGILIRKVKDTVYLQPLPPRFWRADEYPGTNKVWRYKLLEDETSGDEYMRQIPAYNMIDDEEDGLFVYPHEFVVLSLEDMQMAPYGRSSLENMRPIFDQLMSVEALLALTRASRVERMVLRVPMKMSEPISGFEKLSNARGIIKNMIQKTESTQRVAANGKVAALTDWLIFPSDAGYEIDRFQSHQEQTTIEDVEYFRDKALLVTSLPKGYFTTDEVTDRGNALVAQDLKLQRKIIPIQSALAEGMSRLCYTLAAYFGADVTNLVADVKLNLPIMINRELMSSWGEIAESVQRIGETLKVLRPEDFQDEGEDTNIFYQRSYFQEVP